MKQYFRALELFVIGGNCKNLVMCKTHSPASKYIYKYDHSSTIHNNQKVENSLNVSE